MILKLYCSRSAVSRVVLRFVRNRRYRILVPNYWLKSITAERDEHDVLLTLRREACWSTRLPIHVHITSS